jgi:hemoglobin/transferrin/lactoferrin receptor protein
MGCFLNSLLSYHKLHPGFVVIYVGYEWKQLRLNTGIQNIFNEDYRTHGSGINEVGRSVWISAALEI